jgi:hypothetical protein
MKTTSVKLLSILLLSCLINFSCNNPPKKALAPMALKIQFYSMTLSKLEIKRYLQSDTDPTFKRFIIQFFQEQSGNTINYKMRGWLLKQDLTSYPQPGNLLATGSPITKNIPISPVYFANCEVKILDFKNDILDKVGGLNGDWQFITLTPQQNTDGYFRLN